MVHPPLRLTCRLCGHKPEQANGWVIAATLALFIVALTALPLSAQHYSLPNSKLTPGAVNPALVADTTGKSHKVNGVEANLCAKDFRTGPFRKVDESEKKKACAEYGITRGCPGPAYEIDHLISLELGGDDSLANLWPQDIRQARIKDHAVEDVLPRMVCSGKMTLKQAQSCILTDWVACGKKIAK